MASADTAARLAFHAGFQQQADPSVPSISSCTWPGSDDEGRLDEALADFLQSLSRLNHELNGPVPSETVEPDPELPVSTAIAYSVAEVARMLRTYGEEHNPAGLRGAWLVETAWLAVLAGDIDDIEAHLDEEGRAR